MILRHENSIASSFSCFLQYFLSWIKKHYVWIFSENNLDISVKVHNLIELWVSSSKMAFLYWSLSQGPSFHYAKAIKGICQSSISKAFGPDSIPVVFLKKWELELFNVYLKGSCFPDCFEVWSRVSIFTNVEKWSTD